MDASRIVAATAEAWRKYVSVGAIVPSLLRPHIQRAWERSHDQGASPWMARAEVLSPADTDRLLDRHARLVSAARRFMHLLSNAAGRERHAAMLGGPDATVLDVIGDEQSVSGPEAVAGPGSLLSEAMCGSNGIGTPIADRRCVDIVSTEHFIHGFHPFTCHGIPIETPDGELQGVLSVAARRPAAAERLHEMMVCAAYGIGTELARARLADVVREVMAAGEGEASALAALEHEIGVLGAQPPVAPDQGGRAARFQRTMGLLRVASEVADALEERARAWWELACNDLGVPVPIDLVAEVSDIVALLAVEIRRDRVTVRCRAPEERIGCLVDRWTFRRDLFRLVLRALTVAEGGGQVEVAIATGGEDGLREVAVLAVPAPAVRAPAVSASLVCAASGPPLTGGAA